MPRRLPSLPCPGTVVVVAGAVCACVTALGAHATFSGAASPARQAAGRERAMYVSVVNSDGVPVTDLGAREFTVREDGVAREVLRAEKAEGPVTLALAVDNSEAATTVVPDVRRALTTFVQQMGGRHPIAVTTLADRPTILQDYTLVVPQLTRGVERIFPVSGSGAYLLQAIRELATGLARRDFERGVIVAVTTEGPEFSELNSGRVLEPLQQSGASLYAFVFRAAVPPDPADQSVHQRAIVLDQGPQTTGGRRVDLLTSMALEGALKQLAAQLTNEYRITYARPETLIPPSKITVSVTRPGLDARGTPIKPKRG